MKLLLLKAALRPIALLLTLFACACSDSSENGEPSGMHGALTYTGTASLRRLAWTSENKLTRSAGQTAVHWVPREGDESLRVEGTEGSHSTIRSTNGKEVQCLKIETERDFSLELIGPFDPLSFDQVAITLISQSKLNLRALLKQKGGWSVETEAQRAAGSPDPRVIVFDLPENHFLEREIRTVALRFGRRDNAIDVLSIDLIKRPLDRWIGRGLDTVDLFFMGRDGRRVTCISNASPLIADCDPQPGEKLHLVVGDPSEARMRGEKKVLHITLERSGMRVERRVEFEPQQDGEDGPRWHELTIEPPAASGPMRIRALLEVEGAEAGVCAIGEPTLIRRGGNPPTLLIVTSDTHRADYLGLLSNGELVKTPFLDSVAARGVRFAQAAASINLTLPSHAALFTGVSARDMGLVSNYDYLSEEAVTLAQHFREAGWRTAAALSVRKLSHDHSGIGHGFDRMSSPLPNEVQVDSAITLPHLDTFLAEAQGLPLFCWLHIFDAHTPYAPPRPFDQLYYPADKDPYSKSLKPLDPKRRASWDNNIRDVDYIVNLYRGEISYLDEQLRTFLDRPRWNAGILAFIADHGESLTENGTYFRHSSAYPASIHIPFLLAWPAAPAGRVVDIPINHIDVGRTLLNLAGVDAPAFPGKDLLGAIDGKRPRFAIGSEATDCTVQWRELYLLLNLRRRNPAGGLPIFERHEVELYDLSIDPNCTQNIAADRAEDARRLRGALVRWLAQPLKHDWAKKNEVEDERMLQQLAALGYSEGADEQQSTWFDPECDCEWCARYAE